MSKRFLVNKKIIFFALLLILFPFAFAAKLVLSGDVNFWYDPARDFLLANGNLHKLTLIGPTSGIPGIFYGPYWIWLLSFGEIFTLDPKVVILLVGTIPYFTIFPLLLLKFRSIFGWFTIVLLWLLYIFGIGFHYAINPWNPYPAPLLFLGAVTTLTFLNFKDKGFKPLCISLIGGLWSGLLINFHISFGICALLGFISYFVLNCFRLRLGYVKSISLFSLFLLGVIITFIPFALFELRHSFLQTKILLHALSVGGNVVKVQGLDHFAIVEDFLESGIRLLQIPSSYFYLFLGFIGGFTFKNMKKKQKKTIAETQLVLLLSCTSVAVLFVYLSARNPVWDYHFIGVEIIFLLFFGYIIRNSIMLKIIFSTVTLLVMFNTTSGILYPKSSPLSNSSLRTKEYITNLIVHDAGNSNYKAVAYNEAIYDYDYSYLFLWIGKKTIPYDPHVDQRSTKNIYLIMPSNIQSKDDFINSFAPASQYNTVNTWNIPDGTTIAKRQNNKYHSK